MLSISRALHLITSSMFMEMITRFFFSVWPAKNNVAWQQERHSLCVCVCAHTPHQSGDVKREGERKGVVRTGLNMDKSKRGKEGQNCWHGKIRGRMEDGGKVKAFFQVTYSPQTERKLPVHIRNLQNAQSKACFKGKKLILLKMIRMAMKYLEVHLADVL